MVNPKWISIPHPFRWKMGGSLSLLPSPENSLVDRDPYYNDLLKSLYHLGSVSTPHSLSQTPRKLEKFGNFWPSFPNNSPTRMCRSFFYWCLFVIFPHIIWVVFSPPPPTKKKTVSLFPDLLVGDAWKKWPKHMLPNSGAKWWFSSHGIRIRIQKSPTEQIPNYIGLWSTLW